MKRILFNALLVLAVAFGFTAFAQTYGNVRAMGPGPVVSISSSYDAMPAAVKTFIKSNFHKVKVTEVNKLTMKGVNELKLSNGYKIEITDAGQWAEVEAPNNATIPHKLLKKLIPKEAYRYLLSKRIQNRVEEISFDPEKGYKLDVKGHDDIKYSKEGKRLIQ
ncbi:MAG: PepSY-like domain-containing protein [Muribaculaceae bacterium]